METRSQTKVGKAARWIILLCAVVLIALIVALAIPLFVGAGGHPYLPLKPGDHVVPTTRSSAWAEQSSLRTQILEHWANKPLGNWQARGKIDVPRILLARLILRRELDESNAYILAQTPWGKVGSSWFMHTEGDYDFTMAALVPVLFLFGDEPEILYPATREHLVHVLLPLDGGEPQLTVPRTLGLVGETENHLLMTEGARYLKNRWLMQHGSTMPRHDNLANGLEEYLLDLIQMLRAAGPYEFNSIPYEGYTLLALLNLEAFGSEGVAAAARGLLDQMNWNYALGSLEYRRFPPFRRQYAHANDTALDGDRHTALIKTWMSMHPNASPDLSLGRDKHIALWACWSPYRLPDEIAEWILRKPQDYFVRIGHGKESSPEIYSGAPDWLLSAGGVNRGRSSMIVARPVTLMLNDGAKDLSELVYLAGPGDDFRDWNNTGVWKAFAVAAGPVHVPDDWSVSAAGQVWRVYQRGALCVAIHSSPTLGVVHVVRSAEPQAVLSAVESANADLGVLQNRFQFSNGSLVEYDTTAAKDRWVIQRVDGQPVDRDFDDWALYESHFGR